MPKVRLDASGTEAAFSGEGVARWVSGGATVELVEGVITTLTAQQYTDAPTAVKNACTLILQPAANPGDAAALTSSQCATANGSDAATTQTLANALKVAYNAAQADIVALRTTVNALVDALLAAGVTN